MYRRFDLIFIFLVFINLAATLPSYSQCYELVWSDEFSKDGLPDSKTWTMETGGGGWGNNEWEYYTANDTDNCIISNGTLKIRALKESFGGRDYTSARIKTQNKAIFLYGKMEARIKMPYGKGIWPACWMLGNSGSWPACGEMDIVEMIGGTNNDNTCYGTLHWDNNGTHAQAGGNRKLSSGILADSFHIYSIDWTPKSVKCFLDGVKYYELSITPASMTEFHKEFFFILNLAVGGNWPGYPDTTTVFPQTMEVDYIRVYKAEGQILIKGKNEVLAQEKNIRFSIDTLRGRQYSWSVPTGASILTDPDSSVVFVDWGCGSGDVVCQLITSCDTFNVTMPVTVTEPTLAGPMFFGQKAGNLKYTLPHFENTSYEWTIPEGVSIVSGADSNVITLAWGTLPGLLKVKISNECFTDSIEQYVWKFAQLPYPNPDIPHAIPGTINSTDYDYGGEGIAYHDADVSNQGGGPRMDERVDTQTGSAFPNIGYITAGEWLEYSISVKDSGYYKINMKVASGNTTGMGPLRVLVNDQQRIADIVIPATGSWTTYKTVTVTGLKLTPADTMLRILAVKGGFNLGPISFLKDPGYVGIAERTTSRENVNISPNPAREALTMTYGAFVPGDRLQLSILDLTGRTIRSAEAIQASHTFDIHTLLPGMYLLQVAHSSGSLSVRQFIKN
jgi:beta-glucanase (GH16 family)